MPIQFSMVSLSIRSSMPMFGDGHLIRDGLSGVLYTDDRLSYIPMIVFRGCLSIGFNGGHGRL